MKCLVTGASGFVGSALVHRLLDAGCDVIPISRSSGVTLQGNEYFGIDFLNESVPHSVLLDVDVVYHTAGIAHTSASIDDYRKINFEATIELAKQAARARVSKFVFLSTTHVARGSGDSAYSDSKLLAESNLEKEFSKSDMSIEIVRSPLVYGPGVKGNLSLFASAIRKGLPRPPDVGAKNMISLRDLASFLILLGNNSEKGIRKSIVNDGEIYSSRRIFDAISTAMGRQSIKLSLPLSIWNCMGIGLDLCFKYPLGSTSKRLFSHETFESTRLPDWKITTSFEDMVVETFDL